ncbi:MAG: CTP synthase [Paludibacteraceae bacterium]|nr:CTP synthase [Paludibacteraceae bacterium]
MGKTKYIFVTGGVTSSLGKGIISASIGKLLQSRGYSVTNQKFDPYMNVDPGTLNPYEHGECYITTDGHVTDLDLGHYERFTSIETTRNNSLTSGRIYQNVINKERKGEYMGKTVQIIPHITDEIKRNILLLGQKMKYDFVITEIGGVAGDIESLPFLESVRQLKWELGGDCINVHLTYFPYLAAAKELKTKPTQHSVKKLQELGIQPDVLVLRTEHDINEDMRKKVSLFCNVSPEAVIQCKDAPCIYEVPLRMQKQGLDAVILRKLGIAPEATNSDLTKWNNFLDKKHSAKEEVKIALVGKYVELQDAYKSISESLLQAAVYNNRVLKLVSFQSEKLTKENIAESLKDMDAVLVAPGSGPRGVEGKIIALEYCRNNNIPTLGIVLGMQCMAIEFARNVLGLKDANSTEMDSQTKNNVIDLIESQTVVSSEDGYIRSGAYDCELLADSKAADIYGKTLISERHRNRYEFNNSYKDAFEKAGMRITGVNPETGLAEILEIPSLKWYIGVQFHPQYRSSIEKPHPLFVNFVKAAIEK